MNTDKVVNHPIHIQEALQALRRFGVGVGSTPKGGTFASQGTEEGFGMVGVNLFHVHRLLGVGMFLPGGLILGSLEAFVVRLRAFVLDPDFQPFLQRLGRPSRLARADQLMTDFKQQISIAPFAIGQQRQILTVLDDLFQRLDRLLKQLSILFTTLQRPDKATRPIYQQQGPSSRLIGGTFFAIFV